MTRLTTKTVGRLEERMNSLDEGSLRYRVLEGAKNFKNSWIDLGQALYTVWKDKSYKEWGYMTFDAYTAKEIGIRKNTAIKLLKSYYFLEKEEPQYLQKDDTGSRTPDALPTYESVNLLRLAKNKNALDKTDYTKLKHDILEKGKDEREVKRELTSIIRQREELEPEEARKKKRTMVIKRLLGALKTLKTDIEASKMLPAATIKEVSNIIHKIELEIG